MLLWDKLSLKEPFLSALSPFEKRIKRHVIGRTKEFFAVTMPGFESLCLEELRKLSLSDQDGKITPGGVAFKGRIHDCYQANLNLRTANRILMRIDSFRAPNFHTLEKKIAGFPWELYLQPYRDPEFRVTSRRSRIIHTQAIAERFKSGIAQRFAEMNIGDTRVPPQSPRQKLFIRTVEDRFTVSLDSSGKSLYKRGIKKQPATAPIRETTASAILMLAGYSCSDPLLDAMCGSGTFSLEAAMMVQNIPAGWFRDFAFTGWPAFGINYKRWEYLKSHHGKAIARPDRARIFASDIDRNACNLLEKVAAKYQMSHSINVCNRDFFHLSPADLADQPGLVVINPPYGRRIGTPQESERLFEQLCEKLKADYKGWKFALIAPRKSLLAAIPFPVKTHPVLHGGLIIYIAVGKIPS